MASSKYDRAVKVNSSATNRQASQAAPLAPHRDEVGLEVVLRQRPDAAHAIHVLGRLLDHHVDDVVMRHDADHAALLVDDRYGQQVVAGQFLGDVFAVIGDLDGNDLVLP